MNPHDPNEDQADNLGPLDSLPTTRATEFDHWLDEPALVESEPPDAQAEPATPSFDHESEYKLSKAVSGYSLRPSSQYAKLAGISSKTAVKARQKLVERGFIRERRVDSGKRGASTILLELSPDGVRALAEYEAQMKRD